MCVCGVCVCVEGRGGDQVNLPQQYVFWCVCMGGGGGGLGRLAHAIFFMSSSQGE